MVNFQIVALPPEPFAGYFTKSSEELERLGAKRVSVTKNPGFPCRISLEDAEVGEEVILLPYAHHDVHSPYRASGPVYIRENRTAKTWAVNEVPPVLPERLLSLRGYDRAGMMLGAVVIEGRDFTQSVAELFENPAIEYIHVHNAKPGCFSCAVRRA